MTNDGNHLARFGNFVLDFSEHSLQLDGNIIALPPLTLAIIEYLIRNRGRWISSSELMAECWPGVSVSIDSVHRQIADIRRVLGDAPKAPHYVETKYKRGYRFIAEVSEERSAPAVPEAAPAPPRRPSVFLALKSLALAFVLFITAFLVRRAISKLFNIQVVQSVRLTTDGLRKLGPLVTDGHRIFFREASGNAFRIVSIPVSGGEPVPLEISLPNAIPLYASPNGSRLILLSLDGGVGTVWGYSRTSAELDALITGVQDAAVSSDGQRIASLNGLTVTVSSLNGTGRITHRLSGQAASLRWSIDNRTLRFTMTDFAGASSSSEWEFDTRSLQVRRLTTISRGHQVVADSAWSPSGRYFFFEAGTVPNIDIWVISEPRSRPFEDHVPRQLTKGGLGWWQFPCSNPYDESILFALNRDTRSDLVRYNGASQTWTSEWESIPGEDVSWSSDGQWVAYTRLPDYSIWKSRRDGNTRIRLTAPGFEAHQPQWSHDNNRIAFMGKNGAGRWRVYQALASSGSTDELFPQGEDQGVPTWSPNDCCLVFGERMTEKPRADMSIHKLDIASRTVSEIPGSKGLWSPRWSPDGKYILAITTDSCALRLLNRTSGYWWEISRMQNIDNASWSSNSQYIQFAGKSGDKRSLFRFSIATSAIEPILDITSLDAGLDRWFGAWSDGSPIAHRDVTIEEIFQLKLALP
jgi:DNA-binding winged helix-turn-helix (wHTH) protein/Tol biopolymer transport system component